MTNPNPFVATPDENGENSAVWPDVAAFVEEYLLPNWRHRMNNDNRWCGAWFAHAEALSRLTALWTAWERFTVEDDGSMMVVWWRDYCDPMMAALTQATGTFADCDGRGAHKQLAVWPSTYGAYAAWDDAATH